MALGVEKEATLVLNGIVPIFEQSLILVTNNKSYTNVQHMVYLFYAFSCQFIFSHATFM